jgi:uncharacterized paraquat-inducible protein A
MRFHERSYECKVCGWRGALEPMDAGDAAPCPQCGVYLYPLSWMQSWGVALGIIALAVGAVLVVALLRRG